MGTSTAANVITSPRDPTVTIGSSIGPRNLIRVLVKLQPMERPSLVVAGHLIGRNGGTAIVKDGITAVEASRMKSVSANLFFHLTPQVSSGLKHKPLSSSSVKFVRTIPTAVQQIEGLNTLSTFGPRETMATWVVDGPRLLHRIRNLQLKVKIHSRMKCQPLTMPSSRIRTTTLNLKFQALMMPSSKIRTKILNLKFQALTMPSNRMKIPNLTVKIKFQAKKTRIPITNKTFTSKQ